MNLLARTLAVAFSCTAFLGGCGEMCANEPVASVLSPSGANKAVVFTRDCGATTSWSTQVSILRGSEQLPNEAGNTLVVEGKAPVQVTWTSESTVTLRGTSEAKRFKKEGAVNGVSVVYE
jgi:hypothetical protein